MADTTLDRLVANAEFARRFAVSTRAEIGGLSAAVAEEEADRAEALVEQHRRIMVKADAPRVEVMGATLEDIDAAIETLGQVLDFLRSGESTVKMTDEVEHEISVGLTALEWLRQQTAFINWIEAD